MYIDLDRDSTSLDSEDEWLNDPSNGCEITLYDSNHCYGSVMYLIKNGQNGRTYLHTGDFRYNPRKFNFMDKLSNIWIDVLYFDATFCNDRLYFPTKKKVNKEFIKHLVKIFKDKDYVKKHYLSHDKIYIDGSMLGSEAFLINICKRLSAQMYCDPNKYDIRYKQLKLNPETNKYLTDNKADAKIIVRKGLTEFSRIDTQYRQQNGLRYVLYVHPSTQWFAMRYHCQDYIQKENNIMRVLYSMHSDYNEIKQFISKLNVRKIIPFNVPFPLPSDIGVSVVSYVNRKFGDHIQKSPMESNSIFVPDITKNGDHAEVQNVDKNEIKCMKTSLNQKQQNEKLQNILGNLRAKKSRYNSLKRHKTEPLSYQSTSNTGAGHQSNFVKIMTKKYNTIIPLSPEKNGKRKRSFEETEMNQDNDSHKRRKLSDDRKSPNKKISIYKNGIPFLIKARLVTRKYYLFNEKAWNSSVLGRFVKYLDGFDMIKVDNFGDAKYIIMNEYIGLDSHQQQTLRNKMMIKLAKLRYNGCRNIKEIWDKTAFDIVYKMNKNKIFGKIKNYKKYLICSTLDISIDYLKSNQLWPIINKKPVLR